MVCNINQRTPVFVSEHIQDALSISQGKTKKFAKPYLIDRIVYIQQVLRMCSNRYNKLRKIMQDWR